MHARKQTSKPLPGHKTYNFDHLRLTILPLHSSGFKQRKRKQILLFESAFKALLKYVFAFLYSAMQWISGHLDEI